MRRIKDYCDHCGKELDFKKDYGDTEVTVLTFFKADLCAECIEELDNIALEFCGKNTITSHLSFCGKTGGAE